MPNEPTVASDLTPCGAEHVVSWGVPDGPPQSLSLKNGQIVC